MNSLDKLLDSVILEGKTALKSQDAELYNFMQPANKTMRQIKVNFGKQAINPVIERLNDPAVDGPVVRVLLQFLLQLIPTRQIFFETALTQILPSWQKILTGNRQNRFTAEFQLAHQEVRTATMHYPNGFLDTLVKATRSQYPDVAQFALRQCRLIGVVELLGICMEQADAPIDIVRTSAISSAAALSVLDKDVNLQLRDLALQTQRPMDDRVAAFDAWLVSSEVDGTPAALEFVSNHESALFSEPEFLNSVLDSSAADSDLLRQRIDSQLDMTDLTDATLRRMRRLPQIPDRLIEAVLSGISDNLMTTTDSPPERFGLLVHRNSDLGGVFIGHTDIFVSEDRVIDCTVERNHRAVAETSFQNWKDGGAECWGIRRDCNHTVDLTRAVNRAREIASWRTEYDGAHNNQKGEWFKDWFCGPKYWDGDCVGFTEYLYEHAGGNPTPREFEINAGWPLTPREQRDHMCKTFEC